GRQVAVLSMIGSMPSLGRPFDFGGPMTGPGAAMTPPQSGTVSGTVLVDVAAGRVVKATATMTSTMSSRMVSEHGLQDLRMRFRLDLTVTRQ
ncbi:MAG: hypothetical protein ACJ8F7_11490, partial [Gemmataceae bacterium]